MPATGAADDGADEEILRFRFGAGPTMVAHVSRSRAHWPVKRYALGCEPGDDVSEVTTAGERVAMMWRLAREAWALAGRPVPTYPRSEAPSRLYRPGERRDDE